MSTRPRRCIVDGCNRGGVECVPIADDEELDMPCCTVHHVEIREDPSRWQIRTSPISNTVALVRIERADESNGVR